MPERRDPPVAWLYLRLSKLGAARFASARDIARLMERAIKRAGVPVAYSSGFSPHQRVSYATPAPTGAASHAEYLTIGLTSRGEADHWAQTLDAELPAGFHIEGALLSTDKGLLSQLNASRWRLECPGNIAGNELERTVAAFLAAREVIIERRSKSGVRPQDVRAAVVTLQANTEASQKANPATPALQVVITQTEPLIRPADVWAGLATINPALLEASPLLTREAQGRLAGDSVTTLI